MEMPGCNIMSHIDLNRNGSNPFLPVLPVKAVQAKYNNNRLRHRAWMIHSFLKCSVVGLCLSLEEQKRILKKTGHSIKHSRDYEIHETFVKSLSSENKLSIRMDSYLNKKFNNEISEFSGLDDSMFLNAWRTRFQKGEIAGIFWVAATRPDLKAEDMRLIFRDVHMQMHLNVEKVMKAKQRLCCKEEENQKLKEQLQQERAMRRVLKKENKEFEKEAVELRRRYAFLGKDKLEIEDELSNLRENTRRLDLEAENQQLHDKLANLTGEIVDYRQHMEAVQSQNKKLLSKLENQREMNNHLKEETETIVARISALNRCDKTCPSFDLCRKRILIVGGIDRMEALYRQLIEKKGGIFEHCDGHLNGGKRALENRIRRADIVLCPVNINSHNACLAAKKLGKKYSKPVHMLAGSGLNAISQALQESQKGASIQ